MKTPTPSAPLELQEYLFASTSAHHALQHTDEEWVIREELRKMLRLHRFVLMNWLMTNGVAIPVELLADQHRPPVGNQFPDQALGG